MYNKKMALMLSLSGFHEMASNEQKEKLRARLGPEKIAEFEGVMNAYAEEMMAEFGSLKSDKEDDAILATVEAIIEEMITACRETPQSA